MAPSHFFTLKLPVSLELPEWYVTWWSASTHII